MTNISSADHNALSIAIAHNIKIYELEKGSQEITDTLADNLDSLHQLHQDYHNKIEEIRSLVDLYKLVTDLARKNVRNARKWKNGAKHVNFIKANILFQNVNTKNNAVDLDILSKSEKPSVVGL